MPTQINERFRHLLLTVIVSVAVSVFFGFAAGFVAAQPVVFKSLMGSFGERLASSFVAVPSQDQSAPVSLKCVSDEERRISMVEKAMPSVVSVVVSKDMPVFEQYSANPFGNDFFNQFFGDGFNFDVPQYRQNGTEKREVGAGTGFIVSSDGLIVTNKHVVSDDAAEYTVVTTDGEKHAAQVLARDPANDLAVLKIDGTALPFLKFAEDEPKVGESVLAIGYALGQFSNTVSVGIVSGVSRDISAGDGNGNSEELYDLIQTDAAINPGNSGGPLLNTDGEAVGVNVAVQQGAQGIGFALPASDVRRVVESVAESGKISRPFLGVRYVMINEEISKSNQLTVDYGALVVRGDRQTDLAVTPGSPADKAGIVENDIILEIDGEKLDEDNPLVRAVRDKMAGDKVTLKILHRSEEKTVEVTLEERK